MIAHQGLLYGKKSFVAEVTLAEYHRINKDKINKICRRKIALPGKYFPQNVTSLPQRAKTVIPSKAAEKFVPHHTESGWWEGERPLSTLSLSYKAVYREVLLVLED